MRSIDREYLGAWRTLIADGLPKECGEVLFVGEDNPLSVDPQDALYPYPPRCAGERLCNHILELPVANYLACWRTNLCTGRWNATAARDRANNLLVPLAEWRTVILLGKKVAQAFGFGGEPFETRNYMNPTTGSEHIWEVIYLPHPSGRNLVWNSATVRANARMLLQKKLPQLWSERSD